MTSILIAAPAHFLAGLALFTLAAMTCSAMRRAASRPSAAWGLSALIALALAEWCDLPDGSTRPAVWQWARLALETVALVGLIELGRLRTTGPRAGLLPRWSYPLVAALAPVAVLLDGLYPLEFALRLAILWQAGWLAAGYFTRGQTSATPSDGETTIPSVGPGMLAARVIVGALLVYLAASSIVFPLLGMLAALVAACAAFLAFGPSSAKSRQARLLWRCAWPVGFLLIAAGGCFALPAASETETEVLLVEMSEPADDAATGDPVNADSSSPEADGAREDASADDDWAADGEEVASSQFVRQAKRYGVGISPIILFVLFVWGLSRLPFVH